MENSKEFFFNKFFMLLLTFNSSGNKTKRGSGHHHKTCSPSYHGKIPFLYANNNRSTERSPPIASNPSTSASSTEGKINSSFKAKIAIARLVKNKKPRII